jgi:hypothetical protein
VLCPFTPIYRGDNQALGTLNQWVQDTSPWCITLFFYWVSGIRNGGWVKVFANPTDCYHLFSRESIRRPTNITMAKPLIHNHTPAGKWVAEADLQLLFWQYVHVNGLVINKTNQCSFEFSGNIIQLKFREC